LTTRESPKTLSVSIDWTFMPSITLWSHRFSKLEHHEHVLSTAS
jgi:hypothetical protein